MKYTTDFNQDVEVTRNSTLRYVTDLMSKNYESIGFIPQTRLMEYANSGQLLVQTENGDPCGYLVYGNGYPRLRIYQACIQYDARRRQHGLELISKLIAKADSKGCELISLWCAEDLEANAFWREAGFQFGGQRKGGEKRGRKHNLWIFRLPTNQEVFQFA